MIKMDYYCREAECMKRLGSNPKTIDSVARTHYKKEHPGKNPGYKTFQSEADREKHGRFLRKEANK